MSWRSSIPTRRNPPPNLRSLDRRIDNLAREHGAPVGRVRRHVAIVTLGQMTPPGLIVVTGASGIELRKGTVNSRVSGDLDVVRTQDLEGFADTIAERLRTGWGGFSGRISAGREVETPVPSPYRPHRFAVGLDFLGNPFGTTILEVSPDELHSAVQPDTVDSPDAAGWFAQLGLPQPRPLPTLPVAWQIVQKIHACSAPDTEDWVNPRAHDLVDLQLLSAGVGDDLSEPRRCALQLFAYRQKHPWPPRITERAGWRDLYETAARDLPVMPDLPRALAVCNRLIEAIDRAT